MKKIEEEIFEVKRGENMDLDSKEKCIFNENYNNHQIYVDFLKERNNANYDSNNIEYREYCLIKDKKFNGNFNNCKSSDNEEILEENYSKTFGEEKRSIKTSEDCEDTKSRNDSNDNNSRKSYNNNKVSNTDSSKNMENENENNNNAEISSDLDIRRSANNDTNSQKYNKNDDDNNNTNNNLEEISKNNDLCLVESNNTNEAEINNNIPTNSKDNNIDQPTYQKFFNTKKEKIIVRNKTDLIVIHKNGISIVGMKISYRKKIHLNEKFINRKRHFNAKSSSSVNKNKDIINISTLSGNHNDNNSYRSIATKSYKSKSICLKSIIDKNSQLSDKKQSDNKKIKSKSSSIISTALTKKSNNKNNRNEDDYINNIKFIDRKLPIISFPLSSFPKTDHTRLSQYLCSICEKISFNPLLDLCNHIFCQQCFLTKLSKQNMMFICPLTKMTLSICSLITLKEVNIALVDKAINCVNSDYGCNWNNEIFDIEDHLENDCLKKLVSCCYPKCSILVTKDNYEDHIKNCFYKTYLCSICNKVEVDAENENKHIKEICEDAIVCCGEEGNKTNTNKSNHEINGIFPINIKDILNYIISIGNKINISDNSQEKSELLSNQTCTCKMKRRDLDEHLNKDCLFQYIKCPFYSYNCKTIIQRKDLKNHIEKDYIIHYSSILDSLHSINNYLIRFIKDYDVLNYNKKYSYLDDKLDKLNGYITDSDANNNNDNDDKERNENDINQVYVFKEEDYLKTKINADIEIKEYFDIGNESTLFNSYLNISNASNNMNDSNEIDHKDDNFTHQEREFLKSTLKEMCLYGYCEFKYYDFELEVLQQSYLKNNTNRCKFRRKNCIRGRRSNLLTLNEEINSSGRIPQNNTDIITNNNSINIDIDSNDENNDMKKNHMIVDCEFDGNNNHNIASTSNEYDNSIDINNSNNNNNSTIYFNNNTKRDDENKDTNPLISSNSNNKDKFSTIKNTNSYLQDIVNKTLSNNTINLIDPIKLIDLSNNITIDPQTLQTLQKLHHFNSTFSEQLNTSTNQFKPINATQTSGLPKKKKIYNTRNNGYPHSSLEERQRLLFPELFLKPSTKQPVNPRKTRVSTGTKSAELTFNLMSSSKGISIKNYSDENNKNIKVDVSLTRNKKKEHKFALSDLALDYCSITWKINIIKLKYWIAFGVCYKDLVISNKLMFIDEKKKGFNHFSFVLSSNGVIWNSNNKDENEVVVKRDFLINSGLNAHENINLNKSNLYRNRNKYGNERANSNTNSNNHLGNIFSEGDSVIIKYDREKEELIFFKVIKNKNDEIKEYHSIDDYNLIQIAKLTDVLVRQTFLTPVVVLIDEGDYVEVELVD